LATAAAVAVLFYASFFRNPEGLRDAMTTYTLMGERVSGGNAHDKSSLYYLALLGWQTSGGYVWNQLPASLLALIGLAMIAVRRPAAGVFAAAFGIGWFVVVSLTPYKTPWIVVHAVPVLAAWVALGFGTLTASGRMVRGTAVVVVLGVFGWQVTEARMMVFQRPADPRNPLAYVHTSPDLLRVRVLAGPARPGPIRVISPEYWPLPWYLRGRTDVGYWTEVPAQCDAGLLLVAPEWAEAVRTRLTGDYREGYIGLRPGVVLQVFERTPIGRTQVDSQRP
jgi:predicted membrane-bound mannosyltransferase